MFSHNAQYEIDKKLGIQSKQDVLDMGIRKYNEECRAIVMTYADEWRKTIGRLARWVDFDNDYKVRDKSDDGIGYQLNGHSLCTQHLWSPSGGFASSSSTRIRCTSDTGSCHTLPPLPLPSVTLRLNKTTRTCRILPLSFLSRWWKTRQRSCLSGLQHRGPSHHTLLSP
jgi:hypothetical protein